jgi:LysR family transcriptional activator of glutamate synthase operon
MNLSQLKDFLFVSETQSISKAAKKAFISQPAMTKQIKELEEELGVQLFDRLDRGVRINDSGRIFLNYIEPALKQIQSGVDAVSSKTSVRQQPIRLLIEVASSLIPDIIRRIHDIYPDAPVQLTQRITAINDTSSFDFTVTSREPEDTFNAISLLNEEIYVGTAGNEFKTKTINPDLLANYPIVGLGPHNPLRDTIDKYFAERGLHLNYQYESDDPATIRELLLHHAGIGFIPSVTWNRIGRQLNLVRIKEDAPSRSIYLVEGKQVEDKITRLLANELVNLFLQESNRVINL